MFWVFYCWLLLYWLYWFLLYVFFIICKPLGGSMCCWEKQGINYYKQINKIKRTWEHHPISINWGNRINTVSHVVHVFSVILKGAHPHESVSTYSPLVFWRMGGLCLGVGDRITYTWRYPIPTCLGVGLATACPCFPTQLYILYLYPDHIRKALYTARFLLHLASSFSLSLIFVFSPSFSLPQGANNKQPI